MNVYEALNAVHGDNIIVRTRELFLIDKERDEGDSIGTKSGEEFMKNLRILESINHDRITIHQMTNGGSWTSGLAIFDMMVNSPCEFNFICHGSACSMGAVIPQACAYKKDSYRFINRSCCFMIHELSVSYDDSYNQKQQASTFAYTKHNSDYMLEIFCHAARNRGHFFKDKDYAYICRDIKDHMDRHHDWYLTPRETVGYGFMDYVVGTPEATEALERTRLRKNSND